MGLPCVFSTERPRFSDGAGGICVERPAEFNKPLDCATGFGTVTHVTGSFGFALSHLALTRLLQIAEKSQNLANF
jgi:tRNA A37 threonylcarbamoyladenosine dehydratase